MRIKNYILFIALLSNFFLQAQNDTIVVLKNVIVSDTKLKNFKNSQSLQTISDSIISKNEASLTSLLNFNTVIYFKEQGLGMVSSPSFRGTTSQQTAVIWNGININSQLLGQSDFNTISSRGYTSVDVKAGGSSVVYGSGAVGGSIHLNNDLVFDDVFQNNLQVFYGEYKTLSVLYNIKAATNKMSFNASFTRNSSDNDYPFVSIKGHNTNGQFYNNTLDIAFGYKINPNNNLSFYSEIYDGERHFSLTSPNATKTKYQDYNTRNLINWNSRYSQKLESVLKLAYITESYAYFEDIQKENFTFGGVKSTIVKYNLDYNLTPTMFASAILDYTLNDGNGSGVGLNKREIGGMSLLWKQLLSTKWNYELSVRKEFSDAYQSPVLFSIGSRYEFSKKYALKVNTSRNFRIPTFNDLYWQGSGNTDLKPESSFQAEIGNDFTIKNFNLSATIYANDVQDLIRWLPNQTGNWSPVNTEKVFIYGFETLLGWQKNINNHHFSLNGTYAYTVSTDKETKKQLFYVPYHKMTGSLAYNFKKLDAYYQFLFTGEIFTTSDNNPKYILDAYNVSNVGADYNFSKKNVFKIGFKISNLWNAPFETTPARYMPGRNFTVYLNLKY